MASIETLSAFARPRESRELACTNAVTAVSKAWSNPSTLVRNPLAISACPGGQAYTFTHKKTTPVICTIEGTFKSVLHTLPHHGNHAAVGSCTGVLRGYRAEADGMDGAIAGKVARAHDGRAQKCMLDATLAPLFIIVSLTIAFLDSSTAEDERMDQGRTSRWGCGEAHGGGGVGLLRRLLSGPVQPHSGDLKTSLIHHGGNPARRFAGFWSLIGLRSCHGS